MSTLVKKTLIQVAIKALATLNILRRGVTAIGRVLVVRPLSWLGGGTFRIFLLPLYRRYRVVRQRAERNPLFAGIENFGHFVQRYALYAALIGIGVLVTGNNIFARTIRPDEVGIGAVWPKFMTSEEVPEVIVETASAKPITAATPSLALGGVPSSSQVASAGATDSDGLNGIAIGADLAPATDGGSAPLARSETITYTVTGGDTVSTIAHRFGLTSPTILWANNLSETDFIKPGQVLKIPPQAGVLYQVKKGDTLAKIAQQYSGNVDTILTANQLATADAIQLGQEIIIPGGSPPAPAVTTTTPNRGLIGGILVRNEAPTVSKAPPSASVSGKHLFVWPTTSHRINQYYRGSYHTGLDIDGDYSSPIYAAAAGTVVFAAFDRSGYGLHIIIDHGNGYRTLYGHASKIFVKVGDRVSQGQTIAMVGSTGHSTGTHVHFEVRTASGFLNPLSFF